MCIDKKNRIYEKMNKRLVLSCFTSKNVPLNVYFFTLFALTTGILATDDTGDKD